MNRRFAVAIALMSIVSSCTAQAADSHFLVQHRNGSKLTGIGTARRNEVGQPVKLSQGQGNDPNCFITNSSVCIFGSSWGNFSLDLSNEYSQQQILSEISAIYAQLGNFEEARRIADALTIESYQESIESYLESISIFSKPTPSKQDAPQISAEDRHILLAALEEIGAIENQSDREKMLVRMAVEFAEFGLFDKADEIQNAIQSPIFQSLTLVNIAKLQMRYGFIEKSKKVLKDAFDVVLSAECNVSPCPGEYGDSRILDSPRRLRF